MRLGVKEFFVDLSFRINRLLELISPAVDLIARIYVARIFILSGWSKLSDWDSTLFLFMSEYHVPLLPPVLAAVMGTAGELVFSIMLALGVFTQAAALGLFMVNAMAVISYYSELSGSPAAIRDHLEWGIILAGLMVNTSHLLSFDRIRRLIS